jgi:hypothetical protein
MGPFVSIAVAPRGRFAAAAAFASVLLTGCHPAATPFVAVGAAEVASVAVFGKSSVDMVYSAVSGRNCSVVRLDRGESYCQPPETAPPPQPYCTRTLGAAECFAEPATLPDHPAELADGPRWSPPLAKAGKPPKRVAVTP